MPSGISLLLSPPFNNGGLLRGTSSAIEYAVRFLKVKHIVVLGHAGCSGINALATGNFQVTEHHDFQFVPHWLNIGLDAKNEIFGQFESFSENERIKLLEQAGVLVSMQNLLSFPWIKAEHHNGELNIHGWYFDMKKGELLEYNRVEGQFFPLRPEQETTPQDALKNETVQYLEFFLGNAKKGGEHIFLDSDQG